MKRQRRPSAERHREADFGVYRGAQQLEHDVGRDRPARRENHALEALPAPAATSTRRARGAPRSRAAVSSLERARGCRGSCRRPPAPARRARRASSRTGARPCPRPRSRPSSLPAMADPWRWGLSPGHRGGNDWSRRAAIVRTSDDAAAIVTVEARRPKIVSRRLSRPRLIGCRAESRTACWQAIRADL